MAVVEALSRVSTAYRSKVSWCFRGIRCGAARGGLFTCLFWALCRSLLSRPKLHHFYDRKSGNLAAFVSGQFGHVYCRSSLFRSLTAAGTEAAGNIHQRISLPRLLYDQPTTLKNFRGPRVARASRRSKPEARLNAVQRRNRQQELTSHRCRMLAGKT